MKKTCIYNEIAVILQSNNHQYEETIHHTSSHNPRDGMYTTTGSSIYAGLEKD